LAVSVISRVKARVPDFVSSGASALRGRCRRVLFSRAVLWFFGRREGGRAHRFRARGKYDARGQGRAKGDAAAFTSASAERMPLVDAP